MGLEGGVSSLGGEGQHHAGEVLKFLGTMKFQ